MKKCFLLSMLLFLAGCSFEESVSTDYYEIDFEEMEKLFGSSSSSWDRSSSSFDYDCYYFDECDEYSSSSEKRSSSSDVDIDCFFFGICDDKSSSSAKSSSSVVRSSSSMVRSSSSYGLSSSDEGCYYYWDCDDEISSSSVATERVDVPKIDVNDNVFATQACDECNGFMDKRDGNVYEVVVVMGVAWLAEDLRFKGNEDYPLAGHSWCGDGDCLETGRLYDYAAAMNDDYCASHICNGDESHYQGVCPDGWVLPTKTDWNSAAPNFELLKLSGTGEWMSGWKNDGIPRYWTASDNFSDGMGATEVYVTGGSFKSQSYRKSMGYGVRCIAADDVILDVKL